ncbi:unnamed protein product [Ilex paraguariensis]|uniref:Uncharacterized protein n=1 Tax=Ilex paraguariensis TaxID=185542 RepID=A0ABC8TF31_9AQUA
MASSSWPSTRYGSLCLSRYGFIVFEVEGAGYFHWYAPIEGVHPPCVPTVRSKSSFFFPRCFNAYPFNSELCHINPKATVQRSLVVLSNILPQASSTTATARVSVGPPIFINKVAHLLSCSV